MKSDSRQSGNLPVEELLFSDAHFEEGRGLSSTAPNQAEVGFEAPLSTKSYLSLVEKTVYVSLTSGSYFGVAELHLSSFLLSFQSAQQLAEHTA